MAGRAAAAFVVAVGLLCVLCLRGAWAQNVDCADHAHCNTCVVFESTFGSCEWCPKDSQCHDPGSLFNPCASGTSIRNVSQCIPLPPCPTGVDPSIYNKNDALDMIAFSLAAYNADPRTFQNFPPGTVVNVTFTGTVHVDPNTVVNGFTATYSNRIVVAFQGTASAEQLITEMLHAQGTQFKGFGPSVLVAEYFLDGYEVLEQHAMNALQALLNDNPGYEVYVTGHSLGGALASLFALGAYTDGVLQDAPYLYTLGQPRVGNPAYAALHLQNIPNSFRMINNRDPVPHLPPEGPSSSVTSSSSSSPAPGPGPAPGPSPGPAPSEPGDLSALPEEEREAMEEERDTEAWTLERQKTVERVQKALRHMAAERNETAHVQTGPRTSRSGRKVEGLLYAFHHGWEIWYPGGEYSNSVMCGNRFCCDAPTGEAHDCSDSLTFDCGSLYNLCIGDHHGYFNVVPNGWCNPTAAVVSKPQLKK